MGAFAQTFELGPSICVDAVAGEGERHMTVAAATTMAVSSLLISAPVESMWGTSGLIITQHLPPRNAHCRVNARMEFFDTHIVRFGESCDTHRRK
jgi:hypothetical protein